MNSSVKDLLAYITENNGIGDKSKLIKGEENERRNKI